jgi:hypothetical protein
MNRLILKYGYRITAVILVVFAWVVYRRLAGGVDAIIPLAVAAIVVWVLCSLAFIYYWPRITVGGFKAAILKRGFGGGPIPVNTLYAVLDRSSESASTSSVMGTGTDDVLYFGGWLDVNAGPRVLRVPEMDGRYYSVQFTDPTSGANFAYVGKRATGTAAGEFLLCEPGWKGDLPTGMARIDVPHRSALLIGRVFAADEDDRLAAFSLAKQIQLEPLDNRREGGSATLRP